jgi:UDP-N-acetylmuramoylalanine-D-glutamate ligase
MMRLLANKSHWYMRKWGRKKWNDIDRANREIISQLVIKIQKLILLRIDLPAINIDNSAERFRQRASRFSYIKVINGTNYYNDIYAVNPKRSSWS